MRAALLALLVVAPLHAVTFAGGPGESAPVIQQIRAELSLQPQGDSIRADYSYSLRLANPGEGGEFRLILPSSARTEISVAGARLPGEQRQGGRTEWRVRIPGLGMLDVLCTCQLSPRRLPHLHVLGQWRIEIPLSRIRGFAGYPDDMAVAIHWRGIEPECFDANPESSNVQFTVPVAEQPDEFTFEWRARSVDQGLAELRRQLEEITEATRRHDNRMYTETLVALAEVAALKGDHSLVAETCATLARLELDAGRAITHCGPWAKWRKHVPWQLRRVEALEKAGADALQAAASAVTELKSLMQAYEKSREKARPFEDFEPERFGNYWDYDWPRVNALYARAQELAAE